MLRGQRQGRVQPCRHHQLRREAEAFHSGVRTGGRPRPAT
ncbi:hypothetical protein FRUB_08967 [Fimbriiglobus ruber]|uniref:Uncharacterized protein n=1 Tax=Fimbriiglobus ruber TaxID=1908690 RepID=A0A225D9R8_9BACT|nr:hypothetical protein FRUB_08967 [Fimbriiglobus ruber]